MIKQILSRIKYFTPSTFLLQKLYSSQKQLSILEIHTTSDCNYDCKYCYSSKNNNLINWNNIIHQAVKLNVSQINFLGGEPLLDTNLRKYIRICNKFNLKTVIFTNGVLIDNEFINFCKQIKNLEIVVKFDCQSNYEKYTSKNSYDKLTEIITKCKLDNLNIRAHVVISNTNVSNLKEIILLCEELNIIPSFERYIPVSSNPDINKEFEVKKEDWVYASKEISNYYSNKNKYYDHISLLKGNACSCYIDRMSIDINGSVKPCPLASDEQIIGNIKSNSLSRIWKKYNDLKKMWNKIPKECQTCRYKYLCHGGCKTHTFNKYKTYNMKDPLCNGNINPTVGICGFEIKNRSSK